MISLAVWLLGVVMGCRELALESKSSRQWILFSGSKLIEHLCERIRRRERERVSERERREPGNQGEEAMAAVGPA